MAMRPTRGGGASARRGRTHGVVRPVYENFKPMSEWQQDDDFHILSIHVPGFMKEQIKVSTPGRSRIVVRGERLVAGNKWSQFREEFQAPGEINSLQVDYHGGILYVKVPKEDKENFHTREMTNDVNENELHTTSSNPRNGQHDRNGDMDNKELLDDTNSERHDPWPTISDNPRKDEHDRNAVDMDHNREQLDVGVDVHMMKERDEHLPTTFNNPRKSKHDPYGNLDNREQLDVDAEMMKERDQHLPKGFAELNKKERQFPVNVRLALIVIIELIVYIMYKFISREDRN